VKVTRNLRRTDGRQGDLTQGEETYVQLFNEIGRLKRDFSPRSGKGGASAGISHYGFGRAGLKPVRGELGGEVSN
jgi:hypothetical protein